MNVLQLQQAQGLGNVPSSSPQISIKGGSVSQPWWQGVIQQGFQFGTNWINNLYATRAARYAPPRTDPNNAPPPGSRVSEGIGESFQRVAEQFGLSSTTLMLVLAGGAYLLFKPAPQIYRK